MTIKRALDISPRNFTRVETFFRGMGLKVVTGSCYIPGFIGDQAEEATWLEERLEGWTSSMRTLLGVACRHPQTAYAVLQK